MIGEQKGRNGVNGAHGDWGGRSWLAGLGLLAGLGIGAGAALASYAFFQEPFAVRLETLTLHLPRAQGCLPRAGLRLLHLSDSHFRGANPREHAKIERVRRVVAGLEIDLLVHTGDFLHHDSGLENVLALMDILPRPRLGAYAVLGNHDYAVYAMNRALGYTWQNFLAREARGHRPSPRDGRLSRSARLRRYLRFGQHLLYNRIDGEPTGANDITRLCYELERRGVDFLHNRSVRLPGLDLYLAGIDDLQEGQPDLTAALQDIPRGAPTILLSHNPDVLLAPATARADLILAGHTHGGQIVLPFVGPAHTQSHCLSRREASGYLRRGDTHVYIHRGLGEGIPLRFGAPPHLTLLTLLPGKADPGVRPPHLSQSTPDV